MIRYRPHKGSLQESLALTREFESVDEMTKYIVQDGKHFELKTVSIGKEVFYDKRCKWYTQYVYAFTPFSVPFIIGMVDLGTNSTNKEIEDTVPLLVEQNIVTECNSVDNDKLRMDINRLLKSTIEDIIHRHYEPFEHGSYSVKYKRNADNEPVIEIIADNFPSREILKDMLPKHYIEAHIEKDKEDNPLLGVTSHDANMCDRVINSDYGKQVSTKSDCAMDSYHSKHMANIKDSDAKTTDCDKPKLVELTITHRFTTNEILELINQYSNIEINLLDEYGHNRGIVRYP